MVQAGFKFVSDSHWSYRHSPPCPALMWEFRSSLILIRKNSCWGKRSERNRLKWWQNHELRNEDAQITERLRRGSFQNHYTQWELCFVCTLLCFLIENAVNPRTRTQTIIGVHKSDIYLDSLKLGSYSLIHKVKVLKQCLSTAPIGLVLKVKAVLICEWVYKFRNWGPETSLQIGRHAVPSESLLGNL